MDGIHIHPHDILDEGSATILSHLKKIKGIRYIFPQVNTIFERNPYPVGTLTHNPVHEVVMGNGTLHAIIKVSNKLYQRIEPTFKEDQDPLALFKHATDKTDYEVIPWLNIFNGDFLGNVGENAVINVAGEKVDYWLCPNGPDVLEMWTEVFTLLMKKYNYHTFMIDRIRYPDWAGKTVEPSRMLSCFCPHCKKKMAQTGINIAALKEEIHHLTDEIKRKNYSQALRLFHNSAQIKQWVTFRQQSVSQFVKKLIANVQDFEPKARFWLDLWPPSYAWFLGQDYTELTKYASKLKHFPYHKLGGGADVQGLIDVISSNENEAKQAFQAFLQFFDIKQKITYQQFKETGYTIDFVYQENAKVRELSQPGTKIYSGIQMWNIDNENLLEAVKAARQSPADALLYYCYGWAELHHFKAIAEQS